MRHADSCIVRYVETAGASLVLRPHSPDFPVEIVDSGGWRGPDGAHRWTRRAPLRKSLNALALFAFATDLACGLLGLGLFLCRLLGSGLGTRRGLFCGPDFFREVPVEAGGGGATGALGRSVTTTSSSPSSRISSPSPASSSSSKCGNSLSSPLSSSQAIVSPSELCPFFARREPLRPRRLINGMRGSCQGSPRKPAVVFGGGRCDRLRGLLAPRAQVASFHGVTQCQNDTEATQEKCGSPGPLRHDKDRLAPPAPPGVGVKRRRVGERATLGDRRRLEIARFE